ncbi:MAG: hypothetical protein B7Z08_01610 [Sphingomonadales bacterium 32-68-7]|nr:MAG: hypothetical protein B7Z33_00450 [Sphingomonadales bacterium 12-68-11]OYX10276.1 MAG: hypothetical protein B7Z08_01610 [Sphingomonadales bacterium 32-68-7]
MPLKIVLLVVALIQAAAPLVLFFDGFGRQTGLAPTPIVPANYAFAIWGAIYGLSVLFAAVQLVPGQADPLLPRLGRPLAALFALSTLWLAFARFGPLWGTVPAIAAMLVLAAWVLIAVATRADGLAGYRQWLILGLAGLYAGWLTVATFANVTEVAAASGFGFFGLSLPAWTVLALIAGTVLACAILAQSRGAWPYAAAVSWALVAIAIANVVRDRQPAVVAVSLVCLAAVLTAAWSFSARPSAAPTPAESRS